MITSKWDGGLQWNLREDFSLGSHWEKSQREDTMEFKLNVNGLCIY